MQTLRLIRDSRLRAELVENAQAMQIRERHAGRTSVCEGNGRISCVHGMSEQQDNEDLIEQLESAFDARVGGRRGQRQRGASPVASRLAPVALTDTHVISCGMTIVSTTEFPSGCVISLAVRRVAGAR